MKRLQGITFNQDQWSIKGSRDTSYKFVNKKTLDSYQIGGDIISIEQISDDEFLVYRRIMRDTWRISRCKLKNGKIFSHQIDFRNFNFLTEDLIIFDKDLINGAEIYSISQDQVIRDLNHLINNNVITHDASSIKDRKIQFYYKDENDDYPKYLYIDYTLGRHTHFLKEHLQFLLDPNTLKPVTPIYSTLREKYFTLSDNLTLQMLVDEQNHEIGIIDNFLCNIYKSADGKEPEDLIQMVEK